MIIVLGAEHNNNNNNNNNSNNNNLNSDGNNNMLEEVVVETVAPASSSGSDFSGARFGWLILFGIVGVLLRYFLNMLFVHGFHKDTFWSTFIINIIGSTVIGVVQVFGVEHSNINNNIRYGIMVGLLGGFTTFSGYCLDTVLLFERKQSKYTIIGVFYYILSPAIGLAVTYAAVLLSRRHFSNDDNDVNDNVVNNLVNNNNNNIEMENLR